jgi:hypothetical protein
MTNLLALGISCAKLIQRTTKMLAGHGGTKVTEELKEEALLVDLLDLHITIYNVSINPRSDVTGSYTHLQST